MQRLPPLILGDHVWRLPLTDAIASAFLSRLLQSRRAGAPTGPMLGTLVGDSAAVLWCAWQALEGDNATFSNLRQLDEWLSPERLLRILAWPNLADRAPVLDDSATLARWQVVEAGVMCELGGMGSSPEAEEVYHLLLKHGEQWLLCCHEGALSEDSLRPTIRHRVDEILGGKRLSVPCGDGRCREADAPNPRQLPTFTNQQLLAPLLPETIERFVRLAALEGDFEQQLHCEKLRAMKELAYGAGHEINNPLANISTRAQTLLFDETDPERRRKLATINSQAFRAHEMIADMMLYAKPPRMAREPVELTSLIDGVIRELSGDASRREVRLERVGDGPLPEIEADGTHLASAIRAICQNALEAMDGGGNVEINVRVEGEFAHERQATIVIRDTGPGIPAEWSTRIFDPFFSGREAGRGLGFGLSKAWRIIHEHGGSVEADNLSGCGAVFTVRLPSQASER